LHSVALFNDVEIGEADDVEDGATGRPLCAVGHETDHLQKVQDAPSCASCLSECGTSDCLLVSRNARPILD
jgi:hypothetical protein